MQKIFNRTVASNHVSGLRAGFNERGNEDPDGKNSQDETGVEEVVEQQTSEREEIGIAYWFINEYKYGILTSVHSSEMDAKERFRIHERWQLEQDHSIPMGLIKIGNQMVVGQSGEIQWKDNEFNSMQTEIYTDASLTGWGAHSKELQLEQQGLWDYWDAQESSNFRELKTV